MGQGSAEEAFIHSNCIGICSRYLSGSPYFWGDRYRDKNEFQTISQGTLSGVQNPGYYVIQDGDEWAHIWSKHTEITHPQDPLPEVDFSETTIIAVFMGPCRTTGYGIAIKEVIDTGLSIVIKVEKTYPGKRCVVGQMITYPYHIVKVDKIGKYIVFDAFTRASECS